MPNRPLTRGQGRALGKLVVIGMIVQLGVIAYIFYASYEGRSQLVHVQQKGCERGKKDRSANARGWRAAQAARTNSLAKDLHITVFEASLLVQDPPKPDDSPDLTAARTYSEIALGQEIRSRIVCSKAFPKAGLFP